MIIITFGFLLAGRALLMHSLLEYFCVSTSLSVEPQPGKGDMKADADL